MREKVLVTGATGFVGSNLVRKLLKLNKYEIHILTRKTSDLWRIKNIYEQVKDWKIGLNEKEKLKKAIEEIKPDYIVHLAIYGGRPFEDDTHKIIESNFIGTVNLLETCKNIDFKLFINTGSSSEYGIKEHPMQEDEICNPINVYGITKLSASLYSNYIANRYNKNIGTIRLFSPFGNYEAKGRLFPDLVLNALENKDINSANPNAVRDFVYIDEVIDIYLKIIEKNIEIKGEIYNLGYGQQHSVKYVAEKVLEYTESKSKLNFGAIKGRDSDTEVWVSNMKKLKRKLEFEWKENFDEQIRKACKWFKENRELY